MKQYQLKLKGTKKQSTPDLTLTIFGDNKSQAFNWAWQFFQKGEFKEPFFASGLNKMCGGTVEFIPNARELMNLAGKYFVPTTAVTCIR